jgi:formylglycine-generating enzyme required for sulfatase activity
MSSSRPRPTLALIVAVLAIALLFPLSSWAQRVALVIGNAAYADRPLRNPVNDAQLMQATLRELGFQVQVATDVDRRGLLSALRDFEARARGAEVALFYFAGHGAQVGGANYLIPINAPIRNETDVPDEALDASSVLRRIEEGRARVGLVILDACRDNPFPGSVRSSMRGLARMSVPTGSIVAYATAPGSTADDGAGDNGTYTAALARYLKTPGLDIKEVFDRTAQEVEKETNGKQRPREEIGLRGRFVLNDRVPSVTTVPPSVAPAAGESGVTLADLEREAQVRRKWVEWQQRMQTDYDRIVGFREAADLRVQAWQRFLGAWKDDNPTGGEDERLREQAQVRLAEAQREVREQEQARAQEVQRAREQAAAAQAAAARLPGTVFRDCAECPEMVVVPPGRFQMGSPASEVGREPDEGPVREVRIGYPLAVGRHEVTRREFGRFVATTGYRTEAERNVGAQGCFGWNGSKFDWVPGLNWRSPGFDQGEDHPVVCVSWNDAQVYLKWLNDSAPGRGYRLLSEAEWEYAARAGRGSSRYPWGDDVDAREQCAWANGADQTAKAQVPYAGGWTVSNCSDGHAYTSPVGRFRANAFGLHDMHGNVWEWVQDVWHDSYAGAPSDGSAWMGGGDQSRRVLRGGSGINTPQYLRSAIRLRSTPVSRIDDTGFRIARTF